MKTKITLFILLIAMSYTSKAQNSVTIPDAIFAAYLDAHTSCVNGNQLDTTCSGLLLSINVNNLNISDLTGVSYFYNLQNLYCQNNQLSSLPVLPDSLQYFHCQNNQLTSLPVLPSSLKQLICDNNQLTSLPALPSSLKYLYCNNNQLTSIPALPNILERLECRINQLTSLPALPSLFYSLLCDSNQLTSLPVLPNSLYNLYCGGNQLTGLPTLPINLLNLDCFSNLLTTLPTLPNSLQTLYCDSNLLATLPTLPNSLQTFYCNSNLLTTLPTLPNSLQTLYCNSNLLTTLPTLPSSLTYVNCSNNNISCFPVFPNNLYIHNNQISSNLFTCLPNYIPSMDSTLLAYPLCIAGDFVNNLSGCDGVEGIVGYIYKDNNANCIKDTGDLSWSNIPLKSYDSGNNLLNQTYSAINGVYNFPDTAGTYTVKIDTTGMPFNAQCPFPGVDSLITLTNSNPLATDVNFAIACKPGFDVGVQSVVREGWVFPGQQHSVSILAGDISHWYNFNCAAGISGQVQIAVAGPVTYTSVAAGALTPTITGNVFTYTIADFGTINNTQDFGLLLTTNNTAQAEDWICVNVSVTPINGDNNAINNNYQFCYQVVNSYDPNLKEVYPVDVLPGYQDWFTYTIHFQNTGTAPAFNIRLVDTLSNNLDLETFQVINYSHYNTVSLQGKVLNFRFPNIMLPDSTSNLEGSKGFVQYRVKPKPNLPLGTQIQNTASIYFDYNAPIVTNTTTNEFTQNNSVSNLTSQISHLYVYPNPGTGKFKIQIDNGQLSIENYQLSIYNILGEKIYTSALTPLSNWKGAGGEVDLSQQPNGIYIVRVNGSKQLLNQRIIKQ